MKKKNFIIIVTYLAIIGFSTFNKTYSQDKKNDDSVISEITTRGTALDKKDVIIYFCQNLTEYFNTYKYYKISSEVYEDAAKQTGHPISRIVKDGSLYKLQYLGAGGNYTIIFGNKKFPDSEQIFTFGRKTVLGNSIRNKIYDTFVAWLKRTEISLKANNNSKLFHDDLYNAVELEKWYNDLNGNE